MTPQELRDRIMQASLIDQGFDEDEKPVVHFLWLMLELWDAAVDMDGKIDSPHEVYVAASKRYRAALAALKEHQL